MKTVCYETKEPLRENERWICWLTTERPIIGNDGKKTGETKTDFLVVYFFGPTEEWARDRALAFWDDKQAKETARAERGKKLGQSRAKAPA